MNQAQIGLLLTAGLVGGCGTTANRAATGDGQPPSTGQTVLLDEFDGPALDRSRWTVRVTGQTVNDEQQAYVDSAATVRLVTGAEAAGAHDGRALLLEPRWRPGFITPEGNRFDFVSGRLDSRDKLEFTYGTAAARIKLPAGPGFWPAFWALGDGAWPATGEIDIVTTLSPEGDSFSGKPHRGA